MLEQQGSSGKHAPLICHLCEEDVSNGTTADALRSHVSTHNLHHILRTGKCECKECPALPEVSLISGSLALTEFTDVHLEAGTSYALCAYCGLANDPECTVVLRIEPNGTRHLHECKCSSRPIGNLPYKTAAKGTKKNQSRNVPIPCPLCPESTTLKSHLRDGHWRYNMDSHIRTKHSEFASPSNRNPELKRLPTKLWEDMRTTEEEEAALGVEPSYRWSTFKHYYSEEEGISEAVSGTLKRAYSDSGELQDPKRSRQDSEVVQG